MQKLKYFILILIILGGLFFLFGPEVVPENFQPQELLNIAANQDVIIIFNSGGWGNTPLEKAEDFRPIVKGIQETLNEWGYNSIVIPYLRTKDSLLGKTTGAKEFFNSFQFSSKVLAQEVEFLAEKLPDKKIIITGLSNGGAFVTETYEKISEEVKDSVYAIAVGTPFWAETFKSDNILQLDNNGQDSLVRGDVKSLILALFKASPLQLAQVGHWYSWDSPEVGFQIKTFLENKFR